MSRCVIANIKKVCEVACDNIQVTAYKIRHIFRKVEVQVRVIDCWILLYVAISAKTRLVCITLDFFYFSALSALSKEWFTKVSVDYGE